MASSLAQKPAQLVNVDRYATRRAAGEQLLGSTGSQRTTTRPTPIIAISSSTTRELMTRFDELKDISYQAIGKSE